MYGLGTSRVIRPELSAHFRVVRCRITRNQVMNRVKRWRTTRTHYEFRVIRSELSAHIRVVRCRTTRNHVTIRVVHHRITRNCSDIRVVRTRLNYRRAVQCGRLCDECRKENKFSCIVYHLYPNFNFCKFNFIQFNSIIQL